MATPCLVACRSLIGDGTHAPVVEAQSLNHWATRKVQNSACLWMNRCTFFLLLLGFSIEVQSLSLTSISKQFSKIIVLIYTFTSNICFTSSPASHSLFFFFFILTILMTWIGFTVVLIPWLLMKFSSFSYVNWPFRYALLWSAYSSLLTIFLPDCLTFFLLIYRTCLHILDKSRICPSTLSHFIACLFTLNATLWLKNTS